MKFITVSFFVNPLIYVGLVLFYSTKVILIPLPEAVFVVSGISFLWVLKQFKNQDSIIIFRTNDNVFKVSFLSMLIYFYHSTEY
jgi:hypothetical protein